MAIVVKSHLRKELPEHIATLAAGDVLVVADPQTAQAIGSETLEGLQDAMACRMQLFPHSPEASRTQAEALVPLLRGLSFAVAIGSGTINDLVKYASHQCGVPYAAIATAPSMNGYTSPTASLMEDGHKQSFLAHAPVAVYADTEVLCAAPARMIAAGIGDTLCRMTVESDWRLAHIRGKALFDEGIMAPLRAAEMELIAHTDKVAARDPGAMRLLFEALMEGGNAMAAHGTSMPASQGEHMLAHVMEGQARLSREKEYPLHGEQIAVTTLYMAALQERLLPTLGADADWVGAHRHSARVLHHALAAGGCPVTPEAIGWNAATLDRVAQTAWQTRDRYTFLNVL